MKKNLLFLSVLSAASASLTAQDFDGSFDEPWETCYPDGTNAVGTQPKGWMASSVCKNFILTVKKELVAPEADRRGKADGNSVKIWNDYVGMMGIGATAPGYITLGKAWAYGDAQNVGKEGDTSDGGTYGGIGFASRPDSLVFYARRTHAREEPADGSFNPEEKATVVFYSWIGHSSSKVTTGMSNNPVETDMADREKDILGMITEGVTGNAELVASEVYSIEGDIEDWTRLSVPIDYKSDRNPESMNIIFSSADYFNRPAMGTGNALYVDDVQLVYNARLKSLTVDGKEVGGFSDGVFGYQLPGDLLGKEIKAEAFGKDAKVEKSTDGNVTVITVTDETAVGEKKNTYELTFKGESVEIQLPDQAPALTYGDVVDELGFSSGNLKDALAYEFSKEGVIEVGEDGKFRAVGAGEVVVTASQPGSDEYAPAESGPLTVVVDKAPLKVSLAEGAWTWRGMNVSEANMQNGKCGYELRYDGWKWNDADSAGIDISKVLDKSPTVSAPAPKEPETAGSERDAVLSGGEAANYELSFAEETKFKVVKNKIGISVKYGNTVFSATAPTVNVAAGQEEYYFSVSYTDAVYGDEQTLAAMPSQPEGVCGVDKEAAVGSEFPVTVKLPGLDASADFELSGNVPEEAKVVVSENPGVTVEVPGKVTYGDVFPVATVGQGISHSAIVLTPDVISVNLKREATALKAGKAELIITTNAKTVDGVDYGATTTRVDFDVQKAPLTVKARDVEVNLGDTLPETYEIEYVGLVNDDKAETVFTVLPVAAAELPEPLAVGAYPIKVTVSEEPENYAVTTADGTLTVKDGSSVAGVGGKNAKVAYADGNLFVPCGGRVDVYSLTGALVGQYEGTVIPVALRGPALYIVKTREGAFRLPVR